jgi:hypothetical protein
MRVIYNYKIRRPKSQVTGFREFKMIYADAMLSYHKEAILIKIIY